MIKIRIQQALAKAIVWPFLVLLGLALGACSSDDGGGPGIDPCSNNTPANDVGTPGILYTFAGTGQPGFLRENVQRLECRFSQLCDMVFDPDGTMYIVDWNNHIIRHVLADGRIQSVIGTPTFPGDGPLPEWPEYDDFSEQIEGRYCKLNHPTEMTLLPDGKYLLTCWHNHKLRVFDPVAGTEIIVAGTGVGFAGDGLPHGDSGVKLGFPNQAEIGPDGHLYIVDQINQRIRRIRDFMTDPNGIIETVAGSGVAGYNGDGLAPLATQFYFDNSANPRMSGGMVIGDDGVIYVSDTLNQLVRAIDLDAGVVTDLAGIPGSAGSAGDGGPGGSAQLNWPLDLELGPDGRLYIADEDNHAIRAYDFDTGVLSTVAGKLGQPTVSECAFPTAAEVGDGKPARSATFQNPRGIAFDADGRLYIADTFNSRIRVMTLESTP